MDELIVDVSKFSLVMVIFFILWLAVLRPIMRKTAPRQPVIVQIPHHFKPVLPAPAENDPTLNAPVEVEKSEADQLEDFKQKLQSSKPKKPTISAEMLDTAASYDDKVALVRMLVSNDSARVASVLKNMIKNNE